MSQNEIQSQLLTALVNGDSVAANKLAAQVKTKDKATFKEWLKRLTSIFEVHLTVKLLGVTIIDFKIPKE